MKKVTLIFQFSILVFCLHAQARYFDEIFTDVTVTSDVEYNSNWNIWNTFFDNIPISLHMDIYEPVGDTESSRPVVMLCHSGNFLPFPQNQATSGTKTDMTVVEIANRLARRGYVAVSIEYRLGWNPLAITYSERAKTLLHVIYKSGQDARTANRYLRHTVATQSNPYGIDPDKIGLWGIGTGGYISNLVGHLDEFEELIIPEFIEVTASGPVSIFNEDWHGNIYGTSLGVDPMTADTFNSVNPDLANYSSDFTYTLNLSGGLLDSSLVDLNSLPQIAYHVPSDPFNPCFSPFDIPPLPSVEPLFDGVGSCIILPMLNENGVNDELEDNTFNDDWTNAANANNGGSNGLYLFLSSDSEVFQPWHMYDSNNVNATEPPDNESAMLYIDTIMGYAAPRSYQMFFLLGSNVEELQGIDLTIAPNPAFDFTMITSKEKEIKAISLYDLQGRLIQHNNVSADNFKLNRNNLTVGLYVIQVYFEDGVVTRKVLFE